MDRKVKFILLLIIAISFLARLYVALSPIDVLITKTIQDDAFMGISVARNIALGKGITYNGVDKTNGFQPLWPFMLIPIYHFFDGDDALHAILVFASFLEILSIILIFKISQKFLSDSLSLVVSALYGINPFVIFQTISGIDVVLSVFFVLLSFYYYNLKKKKELILGLILGFAIFTRMDNVFLLLSFVLHSFWINRKNLFLAIKKSLLMIIPAIIVISPWLLWSFINFGKIIPSSSEGSFIGYHYSFRNVPLFSVLENNVMKTVGTILHLFGVTGETLSISSVVLSLFIFSCFVLSYKDLKRMLPILLFLIFLSMFYTFYLWRIHVRYFLPLFPFVSLICVIGVNNVLSKYPKIKTIGFFAIFTILFAHIIFNGFEQWKVGYYNWQYEMYEGTKWIKENTQKSDIIGSLYCGTNLYFSDRRVINLDGLLNDEATKAIQEKRLYSYMKEKGVKYWVDLVFIPEPVQKYNFQGDWWTDSLDIDREKLTVIEEQHNTYKHFTGRDLYTVFFIVKVN